MERDPVRSISQTGVFVLFYLLTITVMAMPLYLDGRALVETTVTPLDRICGGYLPLLEDLRRNAAARHGTRRSIRRGARDSAVGVIAGILGASLAGPPGIAVHMAHFTPVPDAAQQL